MSAPIPLFYKLRVYEQVINRLNPTAQDPNGIDTDWVEITADSKSVHYKHAVKYEVQVFRAAQGSTPPGTIPEKDNDGVNIAGGTGSAFNDWKTANAAELKIDGWKILNDNLFRLVITPKVPAVSVTPQFKVQTIPGSNLNGGTQYYTVNIESGRKITTINFTEAVKDPTKPKEVKNDETVEGQGYSQYNSCKKEWVTVTYAMNTPFTGYNVWLIRRDINGVLITKQNLGFEPSNTYGKTPYSDIGRKALLEAYLCAQAEEKDDKIETTTTSIQEYPEADRLNPPSHYYTRDVSLSKRLYYSLDQISGNKSKTASEAARTARTNRLFEDSAVSGRLGFIFQDKDTAEALNVNNDDKKPWGFRFTYNPTTISYSTGADMSVDWMLSSKDPANYIGGNTTVNFKLYLNRIADMTELSPLYSNPTEYGKNYPRVLSKESVAGILNRGTEYDLEFLYRVVNGSPRPSNDGLLTYKVGDKPAVTADFGYITGTPVWIRFHNNLRYKGSIGSVGVEHLIFTENMIPMFSVVDISFIRYPITGETDPEVLAKYSEKRAKDNTTGSDAPKSGEPKPK